MVARTPPKQKKLMVAHPYSLDPALIRQTLKKVDQCMARLQELQYTVSGGKKVVSGVNLSPRSTRAYLKTSLRCKQESIRMKSSSGNNVGSKKSPVGKLPASATGEWRRMSLPAMLVGETVGEILQASKFAREITETIKNFSNNNNNNNLGSDADPKTPVTLHQKQRERHNPENPTLESRRMREKQHKFRVIHPESNNNITPPSSRRRARSRINFKVSPPKKTPQQHGKENNRTTIGSTILGDRDNHQSTTTSRSGRYSANRVSPKHRPWAKKTVLFPNPLFHSSSPTSQHHQKAFCNKMNSPVIGSKKKQQQQQTPHKFLIKSPPQRASSSSKFQVKIKSPPKISPPRQFAAAGERGRSFKSPPQRASSSSKFQVKIKSPPKISPPRQFAAAVERGRLAERGRSPASKVLSAASRLRRSLSPARLVNRLASPLKSRKTVQKTSVGGGGDIEFMAGLKRRNSFMSMRISAPRIIA